MNSKRNVVILNRRHTCNSTTRVLHVSFSGNMQSNIILDHDCAWKSYRGMECDLNGFQSIRYVNGHVDILYSYNVSFAVQYTLQSKNVILFVCSINVHLSRVPIIHVPYLLHLTITIIPCMYMYMYLTFQNDDSLNWQITESSNQT